MCLIFAPSSAHASFIEATIGTAVINDATASYYNPAALFLFHDTQFIALGAMGISQTQFNGTAVQATTGFTETGNTNNHLTYVLPSLYFATSATDNIRFGISIVGNDFSSDLDGRSVLRYASANNTIQAVDISPALGIKINKYLSVGAALTYSYARFLFEPVTGFPSLNIPDSVSFNSTSGNAWGGDAGILLRPLKKITMGFNYRSAITYSMQGKSIYMGTTTIASYNYGFDYWTPARSVFSINYFQTKALAFIGTIQYVQWGIFKSVHVHNLATAKGIISSASIPYNFHNSWVFTAGANYRLSPKLVVRGAGSYSQQPSNGQFQIDTGDSYIVGASMGYKLFKKLIIDASYSHIFILDKQIHVRGQANVIDGTNKQSVNAVALKLTWNI